MLRTLRRLVIGSVACLLGTASSALAEAKWLRLETPDVVILSDAAPKDIVEYAVGYEAYRDAFQRLFAPPVRMPRPTVLLYRDLGTLQKKLPPAAEGFQTTTFNATVDGAVLDALAVDRDQSLALRETCQFQTIFALQHCGYFVPLWMSQGAGEVLDTLELRGEKYEVGQSGNYRWSDSHVPWPEFFQMSTSSPHYAPTRGVGVFQNQAWALMHRVLLGGGSPAANFALLARKLAAEEPIKVVSEFLGVAPEEFDRELRKHASKHVRQDFPFDAAALRKTLVPTPASEVEVHVQVSNLLFAAKENDNAELELAAAQRLAPTSIAVKEARARSALRVNDWAEGIALYREAIAMGSNNPAAYLNSAEDRLRSVTSGGRMQAGRGGEPAQAALDEIHHALKLDPGNPEAYQMLGRALFLVPELPEDGIAELNSAITPGTIGEQVRYGRALLYHRQQKNAECIADLRTILTDPQADPALKKTAAEMLLDVALKPLAKEIDSLVRQHNYEGAKRRIAAAREGESSTLILRNLDGLEKWLDETQAWEAVIEAHAAHDQALTVSRAQAFLERFPDSNAAKDARRIIDNAAVAAHKS